MKIIKKSDVIYWIIGMILCALGVALCTKANFGLSMIAAPPYILHVWLRDLFPWYTQGMSEYVWEGIVLIITCIIIRKFKARYLLSFITAVIFGLLIDGWLLVLGGNGAYTSLIIRIIAFVAGFSITTFAIACFFRTVLPLQVYELSVKEIATDEKHPRDMIKVKRFFDIAMLGITVLMALFLTHSWEGIGLGTVIMTVFNATLINLFSKLLDKIENRL